MSKWERTILGAIGATVAIVFPTLNRLMPVALENNPTIMAQIVGWVFAAVLALAWITSIWIASKSEETHRLNCIVNGASVPLIVFYIADGAIQNIG